MRTSSDGIGQLASALAKAQAELVNPRKTLMAVIDAGPGRGKQSYRYAPLSAGLAIVRKTLGRHELAVVQTTDIDPGTGAVDLTTMLVHASGEWVATRWPVCASEACADPKLMGAALTYARRYSLFALVGLAGEEDLDAPDLKQKPHDRTVSERPTLALSASGPTTTPLAPTARRARDLRPHAAAGPHGRARRSLNDVKISSASSRDPLAELARASTDDALLRWAIVTLPLRSGLEADARLALDRAFRARAEAVGADPEMVLAFADEGGSPAVDVGSEPGEPT
jgi:hypothetical protein